MSHKKIRAIILNMHYTFKILITVFIIIFFVLGILSYIHEGNIHELYLNRASEKILDRNNQLIALLPNKNDYYSEYISELPTDIKNILLKKEDRYFYMHHGINPISILKSLNKNRHASSTITLQLAKVLTLTKGQEITMIGTGESATIGSPILKKCTIK